MSTGQGSDVVVVGGGVIGLGIAWRCALAGAAVTVVDPDPGRGASWAAAGMLAPVTEVHYGEEPLLRLNLAANARWPDFAAELAERSGVDPGYVPCGTVVVARDRDDQAAIDDLFAFQQRLGLDVERLGRRDLRRLEPGLAPSVRGGLLVAGDHQVDNRALVTALLAAVERAGVRRRAARATAVVTAGDAVAGVDLDDGTRLAAASVVIAAGSGSARLGGLPPDAVPPVRPVKGQLLHLRARSGLAGGPVATRTVRGLDAYVVSRPDGRVVVGATVEEQGDDTTVTAGAVRTLLRDAAELLPGIDELALVEAVAGSRPASPDNAPLLGPTALAGLVVASGHYRNGILLTPVTAEGIAAVVTEGAVPDLLRPFDPRRFGAGTAPATARPAAEGVAS